MHDHDHDTEMVGEPMQRVARQRRADLDADGSTQRVEVSKLRNEIKVSRGARRVPQH